MMVNGITIVVRIQLLTVQKTIDIAASTVLANSNLE